MPRETKLALFVISIVVMVIIAVVIAVESFGSVEAGTYVIKQSVGGQLTAIMKPGLFSKNFSTVTTWPLAETFYFTADSEGAGNTPQATVDDQSIEVRFNDGAVCKISGTCRLDMPKSEQDAIDLVTKFGYRDHAQVEQKLILPVIRRALIMTANLMSSKDSYSDRRADFFNYSWDQVANGIYKTVDTTVTEPDPITGTPVTHMRKEIAKDNNGVVLRENNPLDGTGVTLSIFEIKNFIYEDKVKDQISKQQDAIMAVQTARANAQKAVQDALTTEANGKAAVMKAEYEELEKKKRAEVEAQQKQEVATIAAQQQVDVANLAKQQALVAANQALEVAAIDLKAAQLTALKVKELAGGEAAARKMILESDGALAQKLDAYNKAQQVWAAAFAQRAVPGVIMGGAGAGGAGSAFDAQTFMDLMTLKAVKDLNLDMSIRSQSAAGK
jgi:hypothetical protein